MLPVSKRSKSISIAPGGRLAGIRFHPAISYAVFGRHYIKPTLLQHSQDQKYALYQVYEELLKQCSNEGRVEKLYLWADKSFSTSNSIPVSLGRSLEWIENDGALARLSESSELSQRQIERIFKVWLGMTPKYYQRILRLKRTICFLQLHKEANLADVAQHFGFSDQAHMTREFRTLASITPTHV